MLIVNLYRLSLLPAAAGLRLPDRLELPPEPVGVGVGVHEAGDLGLGAAGGAVDQALARAALGRDCKREKDFKFKSMIGGGQPFSKEREIQRISL